MKTSVKTPLDLSIGYQNIEGLHSRNFSCKLPYLEKKFIHDIEILSETWDTCSHSKDIDGYKTIKPVKPQKKSNIKKGRASGGMIIYCKNHLHKYIKEVLRTPHYIWLEINKNIFHSLQETIKICIAYNPPDSSKYCNKNIYEDISTILLTTCKPESPFLLIGDLNSRTGDLLDYQDETDDRDDENSPPRRQIIPETRHNCDKKTNQMGIQLTELCKGHDLQLLNGRTIGDHRGSFTFHDTQQGASTIDVAVVSDSLQPMIKSFLVQHQTEISKHSKIVVRIKNLKELLTNEPKDDYQWIPTPNNYVWEDYKAELLARALVSPELAEVTNEINQYLDAGLVDLASKKLTELYTKAADTVLEVKRPKKMGIHPYKHKQKPKRWFDNECCTLKNICRRLAIKKEQNPENTEVRQQHSVAMKEYKKICSMKKYNFEKNQIDELDAFRRPFRILEKMEIVWRLIHI
jgi:exonuclease III